MGPKGRKKKQQQPARTNPKPGGAGGVRPPRGRPPTDGGTSAGDGGDGGGANRPKNHLITDATSPYTFKFVRYGSPRCVTVRQTPDELTWPGGALWDVGVLMARLLVMAHSPPPPPNSGDPFVPRLVAPGVWGPRPWREKRVLELGCGVGLTGLVAAALGARAALLTDLEEVVGRVTGPNVELNSGVLGVGGPSGVPGGAVAAAPLRWGDGDDETAAAEALDRLAPPPVVRESVGGGKKKKRRGGNGTRTRPGGRGSSPPPRRPASRAGVPDVLLIGDVAYQHRPGAPSHFDDLLSTALRFADERTLLVFGTRMRMPASADLLRMFREAFDEVVAPPLEAHEIDRSFDGAALGRRHNITIHLMRRKANFESGCGLDARGQDILHCSRPGA